MSQGVASQSEATGGEQDPEQRVNEWSRNQKLQQCGQCTGPPEVRELP